MDHMHRLYSVPYCMSPGGWPITDGECPLTCGLAAGGGKLHSCAVSGRGPLGSVSCGNGDGCASAAQGRHTGCMYIRAANPQSMVQTISSN